MLQATEKSFWHEPEPLTLVVKRKNYLWIVVGTACIGAFMGQLDASVTQLVLPVLENEFHAGVDRVSWVAIIYLLVLAIMLPIFGRLSDMIGRKLLYTGGFLTFVIGSGLCGLAPSLETVIASRALQAIGSAALAANSVAIIVAAAGEKERGRALGLQAAVQAIGLCVGPALGGLIIAEFNWRWIFWLNVPVGIAGAIIAWLVLPVTRLPVNQGRFDLWGAILLAGGLASVLLLINEAGTWGLRSPSLWICVLAAAVLLSTFVSRERSVSFPLLSLKLFRSEAFTLGNVALLISNGLLFGLFFLMPFLLQRGFEETALTAGLRLAIIPMFLALTAPISGTLSERYGARFLCTTGMLTTFAGLILLCLALDPASPDLHLITISFVFVGIGQGAFGAPNNSAIMATSPSSQIGEAGGVMNVVRAMGTSMGIAFSAALLSWQIGIPGTVVPLTASLPIHKMIEAVHFVIAVFAGFALLAALAAFARTERIVASART